jgi:hypothetical protein
MVPGISHNIVIGIDSGKRRIDISLFQEPSHAPEHITAATAYIGDVKHAARPCFVDKRQERVQRYVVAPQQVIDGIQLAKGLIEIGSRALQVVHDFRCSFAA